MTVTLGKPCSGEPVAHSVAAGLTYVLLANVLWSFVPLLAKVGLRYMDPLTLTFIRIALSVAGFVVVLPYFRQSIRFNLHDLPWLILGGVGMGGNYTLYIMGIKHTTASAANLVIQVEVVCLILLSWIFLHERMTSRKLLGIFLTLIGVGVVLLDGVSISGIIHSSNFLGNLLIFSSGPAWGLYGLSQKVLSSRGASSVPSLVWIFVVAAVVAGLPASVWGGPVRHMGAGPMFAVAALALICTVLAYIFIAEGFRNLDASTVASTTSILPVFTIINARIWLNENISVAIICGAILVIAGIVTVARADSSAVPGNS